MLSTIFSLKKQIILSDNNIKEAKEFLRLTAPQHLPFITNLIRSLNSKLYQFLTTEKDKKLSHLLQKKTINTPDTLTNPNLVVTIPSDLSLSQDERSLLSKGLSFVPVPRKLDIPQTNVDLNRFYRRIRLRAHFADNSSSQAADNNPVIDVINNINPKQSCWTPSSGRFPPVDYFINQCTNQAPKALSIPSKHRSNLTQGENQALQSLRNRDDIVIKPADKGGAVVVWRKDLYIFEASRQLTDTSAYLPLQQDPTTDYQKEVVSTISLLISSNELPQEANRLIMEHPQ
ncbi:uncharacterized protein [Lepisosteus oculatus]|uniref:uncharacterized protein n=1 Tax=Lepisosteus oculatus TaxID=7918 RepID=UPI0035F5203B